MTIKTKADLLAAMSQYGACGPAVEYVRSAPDTATAAEIWLGCDRQDWLMWFGSRHRPATMRAFAFACADRAVRVYAAEAMARAGLVAEGSVLRALAPIVDATTARAGAGAAADAAYAAAATTPTAAYYTAAVDAAYAAADAAYYTAATSPAARAARAAARAAAAAREAERRIQLDALHALADAVLIGP